MHSQQHQGASLVLVPALPGVKDRVAASEKATGEVLADTCNLLAKHEALCVRLQGVIDKREALLRRKSPFRAVHAFFAGATQADAAQARELQYAGVAISLDLGAIREALRGEDYGAIEERTQEHYCDLKALTLLEIKGDIKADAYRQRVLTAISSLREAQRNIEEMSASAYEGRAMSETLWRETVKSTHFAAWRRCGSVAVN